MQERLYEEITVICGKVRKLDTLSDRDRRGKYRKAIDELFTTLNGKVGECLRQAVFGNWEVPTDSLDTLERCWFRSEEFRWYVDEAKRVARAGNAEQFLSTVEELRRKNATMILAWCGREYKEECE